MNKLFFDLDGTLLDASDRMYNLFCDLIPNCNLTKTEYWDLKRNRINHQKILEQYFPNYNFKDFNENWMRLIEDKRYLLYDKLYYNTVEVLNYLKNNYTIILITARQSEENLIAELDDLNIKKYFDKILVTKQIYTKEELLNKNFCTQYDTIISDTGKDIIQGKAANIKTIGISHGFLSKKILEEYNPDLIIDDLNELKAIKEQQWKK